MRVAVLGLSVVLVGCPREAPPRPASPAASSASVTTVPQPPVPSTSPSAPAASASSPPVASASSPVVAKKLPRAHLSCDPKRAKKSAPFANVRDVDWCNATVVPGFATLRDGAATVHDHLDDDPRLYVYHLGHVAYGDLDGDGVDEAVVVFDEAVATGVRGRVTVFDLKAGQPRSLDVHEEDGVVETSVVAKEVHLTVRGSKQVCSSRASLVKGHLVLGKPACAPL
ncbi:MAG: hypothetical protein IPJ34_01120 [Myxococcales bacterium]|nr:hypothetical protein [Myxococcales bacterium]